MRVRSDTVHGNTLQWRGRVLALGALLLSLAGCTLLVEKSTSQCSSDSDCAALGSAFVGTTCSAQHVCISASQGGTCTTNAQCTQGGTQHAICRKDNHTCQLLLSTDCTKILQYDPSYEQDDNSILLGVLTPLTGGDPTGATVADSVQLALDDFGAQGIPPLSSGEPPRHLVFVLCDDNANPTQAAQHLVNDLGVPAVLGPAYSGTFISVATNITIPAKVLAFSSSATSARISGLMDYGLVWRTSPSDTLQAQALSLIVPGQLEPLVRSADMITAASTPIKLALVYKGDAYGSGLGTALGQSLMFNGMSTTANGSNFLDINLGDPAMISMQQFTSNLSMAVTKLEAFAPHIIIAIGTNEVVDNLMSPLENGGGWTASYRPYYLFTDGGDIPTVSTDAPMANGRIFGTVPGTNNPLFQAYAQSFSAMFTMDSPQVFGGAGAYDVTYMFSYAAIVNGAQPLTGPNLNTALHALTGGTVPINAGPMQINTAETALVNGGSIDFHGASGPLRFSTNPTQTAEAPSDIQVWCPMAGGGTKLTGLYLDSSTGQLAGGTLTCPK